MQTECPNCHTVFRIAQAQLDMADGMVRCGFCKEVFDARVEDNFLESQTQLDTLADTQQTASPVDKAPDDASLFSADNNDDIVANELETERATKHYSAFATIAWSLAILALIATLVAEYIWFNQPELLQHEKIQPLTANLCERVDCAHLQIRAPSKIEMISRNIYSHPNEKQALMISTTIVNHAAYAQPYPAVQIDFSNVRGEMIASRRFTAEEYLQIDKQRLNLLESGTPITFGLEIKDPGKQAMTYEFSFH